MSTPPLGRLLFSFVVVADTHVNERDDFSSSPFATNRLANERARHVFRDIAAIRPAPRFAVHLGDMVHPLPSLPTFLESVARYKALAAAAGIPVHAVPGNHDVGDKNVDWMPADKICGPYLELYRSTFGEDCFAFEHEGLRFIGINSVLLNSGLPDEARHRAWLEREFAAGRSQRVFAFLHYPPYIHSPDERSHYDNIDQPGRAWLLGLLGQPNVEAVFAGHVHNFWYDRIGEAEFYMLPSTAFVRHDFAEFSRTDPGEEFGRNDLGKFGYFRIDVFERGHAAHLVRTMGAGAPGEGAHGAGATGQGAHRAGAPAEAPRAGAPVRSLVHPKTSSLDRLGVELRHPWAESMQIAATGGIQEFGRKWARNDYPLLALWEMGAKLCKVPDGDLVEADSARRMQQLARIGQSFVVTTLGAPRLERFAAEPQSAGVLAFEVNTTAGALEAGQDRIRQIRSTTGARILFAKLAGPDPSNYDGQHFSHVVKSGFTLEELARSGDLVAAGLAAGRLDGITVRVEADEPLVPAAARIRAFAERTNCVVLASLKLSGPSLARARHADAHDVLRVAQAAVLSQATSGTYFVFDTFMDVDRGYFPRHAFIDRRFNPRATARAFATMNGLLTAAGRPTVESGERDPLKVLQFGTAAGRYALVSGRAEEMEASCAGMPSGASTVDLVRGREFELRAWLSSLGKQAPGDKSELEVALVRFG